MSEGVAPAVSVCIVAYEARGFIGKCIGSVFAHTHDCPIEVLLIDNGTDGTAALVAREFPQVRVLPSEGNIGFGAGCNRLVAAARGDNVLFLNPDAWLTDPAIDALWRFAQERHEAGAWGGRMFRAGGGPDPANALALPTLGRLAVQAFGAPGRRSAYPLTAPTPAARQVEVISGGFVMFPRRLFAQLGGFDESFFLYSEEVDLFARLGAAGHVAWTTPDANVLHDTGSGQAVSPARARFMWIGAMHYLRKHWPPAKARLGGVLLWFTALRRVLGGLVLLAFKPRGKALLTAYWPLVSGPGRWWRGYADGAAAPDRER